MSSSSSSVVIRFLRELCDSYAVKRHVTLLVRQYGTMIGQHGRKYGDFTSLHRAGEN